MYDDPLLLPPPPLYVPLPEGLRTKAAFDTTTALPPRAPSPAHLQRRDAMELHDIGLGDDASRNQQVSATDPPAASQEERRDLEAQGAAAGGKKRKRKTPSAHDIIADCIGAIIVLSLLGAMLFLVAYLAQKH